VRRLKIEHVTQYDFGSTVELLPHRLVLRPRESHTLRIASARLEISPTPHIRWHRDALDNSIAIASFGEQVSVLRIESEMVVEHYDEMPLDFLVEEYAVAHPFQYHPKDAAILVPFLSLAWPSDRELVARWLATLSLGASRMETFAVVFALNAAISRDFRYEAREEPGVQSPADTLGRRSGSCRDFAALFLEACRQLGLAARFVSGYHTSYAGEGAGSTHAWAEVYLPGPGWKGFDPSGGVVTGGEHIAVAVAHHPEAVPPVSGSYLGPVTPKPTMLVTVRVLPA